MQEPADRDPRPHVMRFHFGMDFGGIESMLLRQLPRLNAAGFRTSLCLLRREGVLAGELRASGTPVHLLRTRGRLNIPSVLGLARFLREQRVSIAHAHTRSVYVPVTIAARLARTPVMIGSVHETHSISGRRRALQERLLDHWRDCTVTVSDEVAHDYCVSSGVERSRCITIYNGLDADAFRAQAKARPTARAALGLGEDELAVMSIGRLQPQKRHEVFIEAARLLRAGSPELPVRFFVVGEGARLEELRALADASGLRGRCHFLGARRDIPSLLAAADICCLTSRREGFSNVILESLIMGVPLVSTDAGGVREALAGTGAGVIVPVGDAPAVAGALADLLADPALRHTMAAAAMRRAETFSIEANIQATVALYRRLLARHGVPAGAASGAHPLNKH